MLRISEQLAIRSESLTRENIRNFFVEEANEFVTRLLDG